MSDLFDFPPPQDHAPEDDVDYSDEQLGPAADWLADAPAEAVGVQLPQEVED